MIQASAPPRETTTTAPASRPRGPRGVAGARRDEPAEPGPVAGPAHGAGLVPVGLEDAPDLPLGAHREVPSALPAGPGVVHPPRPAAPGRPGAPPGPRAEA